MVEGVCLACCLEGKVVVEIEIWDCVIVVVTVIISFLV